MHLAHDVLQLARGRLGLRRDAGDRDLLEPVPLGEVAERCVARDDLVALAVGEAAAELAVEGAQPRREALGLGATVELLADPLAIAAYRTGSSQT